MLWIQGLDSNFLENTPEQTALRSIATARLGRALEDAKAANAEAQEGDEFSEVEENDAPKKVKKTRKPRAKKAAEDNPAPKKRGRPRKKKEPVADTPTEETPKGE